MTRSELTKTELTRDKLTRDELTRKDWPDFDLDDAWLRRSGSVKWTFPGPEVLPAWVAEIDVAPCPAVSTALHEAIDRGALGYPPIDRDSGLPEATVDFLAGRFGWQVDPARVMSVGDVMAGIMLILQALCEPGPVIVPVPAYPPFLAAVPWTSHQLVTVPMLEPAGTGGTVGWTLDLERIDQALTDGARTVLLTNPHNPTGRCFSRAELEALRDVVVKHGARVISDEIHAPLTLPGAVHTPYSVLDGTAEHVTTLVAASKAWNLPGLKCAQLITGTTTDAAKLRLLPPVTNHGTSPLGVIATIAAYRDGGGWLDGLIQHLSERREQLGELLAQELPSVSWTPAEGTYLAWLDVRAIGLDKPSAVALRSSKVLVNDGATFGAEYPGFVRVNYATSAERLARVIHALAAAWG